MATLSTPTIPTTPTLGMQCDPNRLAAAVVARFQFPHVSLGQPQPQPQQPQQPQPQARVLDRGAFATLYLLSACLPPVPKSFLVRVSTRPVYNLTARRQEKDKIRGYVGVLLLIHARAPASVRTLTPRILAYDASESCEFGHGWIAMTRLPGRPLSESWSELSPAQRDIVARQLATFTRHLSCVGTSSGHDEDDQAGPDTWPAVGSLLVRGDCQTFSIPEATDDQALQLDLGLAPLLFPKRHGANNLRPVTSKVQPAIAATNNTTSSSLLFDDADDDDDYLSCYEVLLPTPSPPSSPDRIKFLPISRADTELPTSAVLKSCEDWLAGIKSGTPEIVIIEVEDSSTASTEDPAPGQGDADDVYASLALWDKPSASDSPEETPYSTPMSTVLQLDEEGGSAPDDVFAISFVSTPAFSPVAAQTRPPLTLSIPASNHMKPSSRRSSSTNTVQVTCVPAACLPSTTLEMFHAALDAELAFLKEHQPAAARCFNNNMLRLTQSGMADEIPRGALPAAAKWDGYSAQLQALKAIVREVVDAREQQHRQLPDERLLLGRVGWDAADVLVQVEEDEDGEEQVRVTGVVDWEFAGVVPQWMIAGLPGFLRSSSSTDGDDDDDDDDDDNHQEGDGILPVWVQDSWALPTPIRNDDRLASAWRDTLDMEGDENQWETDELVRAAWKVANVEWHEVQRACAWARGYLSSHHHHQHSHSSNACQLDTQDERYLAVDVPSDGECSSGGCSRRTNDTQETAENAMPVTPTDDEVPLPPAAVPTKGGQPFSFAGVFFSGGSSDEDDEAAEDSEDEEESDEEDEEEKEDCESASDSHDWRDEFESAFMFPAPLPSATLRTSSTRLQHSPQPTTSRAAQQKQKKILAEERKRRKQAFERGMNDAPLRAGYEILWEHPPPPTKDDVDFVVERDLDAGW